MAHPCWNCNGECYCHGDVDDVIVSHTPGDCDGCDLCQDMMEEDRYDDYEPWPEDEEE